ncbi:GNAT family N-acetyltransferase [Altererythrobacter sp. ZODW24]|uniref:GNAT family N-acetyltransferase n=1 Tax=Altererythrobacter sp. ZODW24 TaxID=2185142 RepID=UPI000DF83A5A|nr:GNAT family N-acetyltransferase [Altererythrobacter sp. ZODW24]
MTEVTITHEGGETSGKYTAEVAGADETGKLTWKARGGDPAVRIADHTIVPPAIGGQGVAAKLVDALIADAREQGFKIVPQCSYVAAKFERNPDWADLLA